MGCGQSTDYKDFKFKFSSPYPPFYKMDTGRSPPYEPGPAQEFSLVMLWVSINVPETILTVRDTVVLVKLPVLKEPPE